MYTGRGKYWEKIWEEEQIIVSRIIEDYYSVETDTLVEVMEDDGIDLHQNVMNT